ncbi:MAG: hypothetical protein WC125_05425 [Bacteroidales bacterium]
MASLPIGAYLTLQIPSFQTLAAKKAAASISKSLGTEVTIGKVYYIFFNKLIANDLTILYSQTDTLVNSSKISVNINTAELLRGKLRLKYINLYNGVFNLVNETDSTTNVDRIFSSSETNEKKTVKKSAPIIIQKITLNNFRFTMSNRFNPEFKVKSTGINFSNLEVNKINAKFNEVTATDSSIRANVAKINFTEKSGFTLKDLTAGFYIEPGGFSLDNLTFNDGNSFVDASYLSFQYSDPKPFTTFTESVSIDIKLNNSKIDFSSIAYFAPSLWNNKLLLNLDGTITGPVSNLRTENLQITTQSGLTYIDLDAKIIGLPNSKETIAFVDINNSTTTTKELSKIVASLNSSEPIAALEQLPPLIKYNFKGRLAGMLDDFVANGTISSNIGELYLDALLKNNPEKEGLELQGNLATKELNIGVLMGSNSIEKVTLSSKMNALLKDKSRGGSQFFIDNLNVSKFDFNDYSYKNINATGSYLNNTFDGKVICRDPNLNFLFQGIVGLSTKTNSYYDFYTDVIYANIAALNFDKRDSVSAVSMKTYANFTQNSKGDIEGTINVRDLNFQNSKGDFPIGDISVQSSSLKDNFTLFLRSTFANATYRGNDFFTNFIDKFLNITLQSNLYAIFPKEDDYLATNNNRYTFSIEFNDSRSISQFILPGLFISQGSTLDVFIDEQENLSLELKSSELGFEKNYSNNISLSIEGDISEVNTLISSDRIHFSGINLDSSRVHLNLKENNLKIKSEYTNSGDLENRLDFFSDILFTKPSENDPLVTDVTIYPSELFLNGQNWKLSNSKIVNQGKTFVFHDLDLFSENQHLNIDGIVSNNNLDTLSIKLKGIDISPVNSFIKDNLELKGKITGTIYAVNLYDEPQIVANIHASETEMYGHKVGNLNLESNWNNIDKVFDIKILNTIQERVPLSISGTFHPKENYLKLNASLNNLSVSYFEPFLIDIISKTDGDITGDLILEGPLDKLSLTSKSAKLNNFSFLVDFTQVRYTLNGPLILTENGISLNNVAITDRFGSSGRILGGINYKYFKDLELSATIQFNNFEALNTTETDNTDFYGTAFGTGRVTFSGPLNKILIDAAVTTNRNTSIHIPLSAATDASGNNLLTFVKPYSKTYDQNGNRREEPIQEKGTELIVKLKANVTPEAAMLIEIDKTVGDIITGYGTGLIYLDINPSKDIFSVQGDYNIQRGSYKFVLQGFIERDFTIEQGGNIGFNGDIMKTNLNLTANYKTKAAINTLIADTSSVANRRSVDCRIDMTGQLMNPRLGFGIEIPDIDPITKARVNAALNTEDKVVRQVMSLLVSGSFIPDVQSTIVNNSTILYSNATEVLSNQINKIFNQLDIPLDLSFNYQPGQNGRDLFDAAISAQLFNNRVVVNGNIGSAKYMDKSGDVVGDIDVEIKLDDKGRFRAKAFSHSADQYSNYLDNSQRSGIGLVYQEEFSSFKELINSLFMSKKKRAEKLEREISAIKPSEETLIPEPKIKIDFTK